MSLCLENIVLPLADMRLEIDLTLRSPVTGLTGPSGAGKTSLLELIAGLRRPQSGRIFLDDALLVDAAAGHFMAPEKRRIAYVPQDLALFPHLGVMGNLRYGLRGGATDLLEKTMDLLEIRHLSERRIIHLSGGEKQRVALGRALLTQPKILLLDEPLSHLDDRLKSKILPFLQRIRSEFAVPMIYVSHSQAELSELCDDVLTMERGRIR